MRGERGGFAVCGCELTRARRSRRGARAVSGRARLTAVAPMALGARVPYAHDQPRAVRTDAAESVARAARAWPAIRPLGEVGSEALLALQRTAGNRAVARLVTAASASDRRRLLRT